MAWRLKCRRCGFELSNEEYAPFCPQCGTPLDLTGEFPRSPRVLGEGFTPEVIREFGSARVVFKLEYLNPSGSFKDRGSATSLWLAKNLGFDCVVEDSSGNTGLSVAMYSRALGLKSYIIVPKTAGLGKKLLLRALGANLIETGTREEALEKAISMADKCFYVAHVYSPIFVEGISSIALELSKYAEAGYDFLVPTSSGTLLLGLYFGFKRLGLKPRLIAVQASEASPLASEVEVLARIGGSTSRLADALVVKHPPRLSDMVNAIKDTKGGVVVVGDKAIKNALRELLRMGFIVEPSSAVVWAAFKALNERGITRNTVMPLTGSGLKYGEVLSGVSDE